MVPGDEVAREVVGRPVGERVADPPEEPTARQQLEATGPAGHGRGEPCPLPGDVARPRAAPPARVDQTRPGRFLADPWRADRHAVQQLAHLPVDLRRGHHGTHPVPGDRQVLGERVQAHQGAVPVRIGEQVVGRLVGAAERPVRLVDDQRDVVPPCQLREGGDARGVDRHAAGVARGDQHDGAGTWRDQRLRIGRAGHQVGSWSQVHRPDAGHPQPHVVVEVVRQRHDQLVTGTGQCRGDQTERLVAAGGDHDVVRGDRAPVVAAQLRGERLAQVRQAGYLRVGTTAPAAGDPGDVVDDHRCGRVPRSRLRQVEQRRIAFGRADQRVRRADRRVDLVEYPAVDSHGSVRLFVAPAPSLTAAVPPRHPRFTGRAPELS